MSKDITIGDITVKAGEVKRCKIKESVAITSSYSYNIYSLFPYSSI